MKKKQDKPWIINDYYQNDDYNEYYNEAFINVWNEY
mgnify:CR=1 FL=1